jgi:hypothetical protein
MISHFSERQALRDAKLRDELVAARAAAGTVESTSVRDLVEALGLLAAVYVGIITLAVVVQTIAAAL